MQIIGSITQVVEVLENARISRSAGAIWVLGR